MLEFEYGPALVGAFAPLEGGRKFGTLLALEISGPGSGYGMSKIPDTKAT